MSRDEYIKQLELKLDKITDSERIEEIKKINEYIDNGVAKGIEEAKVMESLGNVDDLVNTINLKYKKQEISKKTFKDSILNIWNNLKKNFTSKAKNVILKSVGNILYTLLFAILIKVPFIFVRTLLLDFLNSSDVSYTLQNIIAGCFEVGYVIVAVLLIYRNLKKYFDKD